MINLLENEILKSFQNKISRLSKEVELDAVKQELREHSYSRYTSLFFTRKYVDELADIDAKIEQAKKVLQSKKLYASHTYYDNSAPSPSYQNSTDGYASLSLRENSYPIFVSDIDDGLNSHLNRELKRLRTKERELCEEREFLKQTISHFKSITPISAKILHPVKYTQNIEYVKEMLYEYNEVIRDIDDQMTNVSTAFLILEESCNSDDKTAIKTFLTLCNERAELMLRLTSSYVKDKTINKSNSQESSQSSNEAEPGEE